MLGLFVLLCGILVDVVAVAGVVAVDVLGVICHVCWHLCVLCACSQQHEGETIHGSLELQVMHQLLTATPTSDPLLDQNEGSKKNARKSKKGKKCKGKKKKQETQI